MQGVRGFTLVELMVTVAIVAILASIAVPSYRSYIMRTNRTDARTALLRIQTSEEKFFLQNNTYTDNLTAAPPAGLGLLDESENGLYTLEVQLTDGGAGFTATATPVSGKAQDDDAKCASFTINQSGVKTASGADPDPNRNCWK